jgi:UDP-N-acetylmuramoylalanine-D-glutamate ligase
VSATLNGYASSVERADLHGKRVLVYSMGMEGRDLARFMLAHGAAVTMSDTRTQDQLDAAGAEATPNARLVPIPSAARGHGKTP